jgi:hypothetical protein
MIRGKFQTIQWLILAGALLVSSVAADSFELARSTVDGGGTMFCTGGEFEFSGTIGQPDAGAMSVDGYTMSGGFWFPVPPGDGNEDGVVDLADFRVFNACMLGPAGGLDTGCVQHDMDASGHIDVRDFAAFQRAFTTGS